MKLIIERGKVWDIAEVSPNTIALDGAIMGPVMDTQKKIYSFDHHGGCVRHSTAATCQQVLDALVLGLDPNGFEILINDIDGDTVLSVWLLDHDALAISPLVQRLTRAVGNLDAHGPAYPAEQVARDFHNEVMSPVEFARKSGDYGQVDLRDLLNDCLTRMDKFFAEGCVGAGKESNDQRTYEVTHRGDGFIMAKSGNFVMDLLYEAGHTKVVAYMETKDGSYAYTIAKKSEFVDFPVKAILNKLNELEPGWGGGSTIGGAPRNEDGSRSKLTPDQVSDAIKEVING